MVLVYLFEREDGPMCVIWLVAAANAEEAILRTGEVNSECYNISTLRSYMVR